MHRRLFGYASLLLLAACSGERVIAPDSNQPGGPAFAISNIDPKFAWRPPIANQTATGTFNPALAPQVRICTVPTNVCQGPFTAPVVAGPQYQYDWKSPKTAGKFRVSVTISIGGTQTEVGFADVNTNKTAVSGSVNINAGSNLPIKFVLTYDCSQADCVVDPNVGGTITVNIDGNIAGVSVPPQDGGGPPIHLNIKKCDPDLSSNGLTVFGTCITINSDLQGELSEQALVFICDALSAPGLPEDHETVELHRRHNGNITQLENAAAPLCPTSSGNATIGGVLRALAHGDLKQAGSQFAGLFAPKPLYASVLHLGPGGTSGGFSDFQFAEISDPLPIEWTGSGWSYQIDGTVGTGWETGPLFGAFGQGGFGEDHNACSLILSSTNTAWPAGNTNLYLRRNFLLSEAATVNVEVAIDNDIQIFVDGMDLGPATIVHDGCPTRGSAVRSVTLPAGVHFLGIRAIDRGGSSYFDARVTVSGGGGGD